MKTTTPENLTKHLPKCNQQNSKKARQLLGIFAKEVYFFTGQTSTMQVCKTLGFARVIPIQRKPDPTFKLKKKKTLITVKKYMCVKCNIKGT